MQMACGTSPTSYIGKRRADPIYSPTPAVVPANRLRFPRKLARPAGATEPLQSSKL